MLPAQELRLQSDSSTLATLVVAALLGTVFILTSRGSKRVANKIKTADGKPLTPRVVPSLDGTLPILGNILEVLPNHLRYHEWLLDVCTRLNFVSWQMKMPGQAPLYMFSSLSHFEEILATQFDTFPKGVYQLEMVTTFFGKSVVGSDGERWYHQRKTAVKFFSTRSLRAYMATSARRNVEHVLAILERGSMAMTTVNLTHLMMDFTMQTFVETGLGITLDWIGREQPHPFTMAMDEASELVAKRFVVPGWVWKLQRAMNVGDEAKLATHMEYIVSWIGDAVKQSLAKSLVAQKHSEEEEVKSLVDLFVEYSREDAEGIRAHDIVDFIQVMIIAAQDTTAIALT